MVWRRERIKTQQYTLPEDCLTMCWQWWMPIRVLLQNRYGLTNLGLKNSGETVEWVGIKVGGGNSNEPYGENRRTEGTDGSWSDPIYDIQISCHKINCRKYKHRYQCSGSCWCESQIWTTHKHSYCSHKHIFELSATTENGGRGGCCCLLTHRER
jgi:hypothetical protein